MKYEEEEIITHSQGSQKEKLPSFSSSFPQQDIKVKKEIPNLRCASSSSSFPQDIKVKKEISNLRCASSSSSFPQENNKVKKEIPNLRCPSHRHLKATPPPLSADFCERCDLIDFYYHNVLKGSDDDDSLDYFVSNTLRHCEFGSAADTGAGSKEASPPPPPQTPLQGSESAPADITGEEVSEEPIGGSPESGRGALGGGLTYFFFCIAATATATTAIGVMGSFEEADAPEEMENGGEGGK